MTIRSTTTDYTAYHSSLGILPSDSSNSQSCSYDDNYGDDDDDVADRIVGIKSHEAQQIFRAGGTRRRSSMILLVGLVMVLAAGGTVMHQGQLMKTFLVEQIAALCTTTKTTTSSSGKRGVVVGGNDVVYKKAASMAQKEEEEDSVDDEDDSKEEEEESIAQKEDSVDDGDNYDDEVPSSSLTASTDDGTLQKGEEEEEEESQEGEEEEESVVDEPPQPRLEISSAQTKVYVVPKAADVATTEQREQATNKKKEPRTTKDDNEENKTGGDAGKEATAKATTNATVVSKGSEKQKPVPSSSSSSSVSSDTPSTASPATTKNNKMEFKKDMIPTMEALSKPTLDVPMDEFRLCRVQPEPVLGDKAVIMNGTVMPVDYQCAGEPYEEFATQLEKLIQFTAAYRMEKYQSRWGRRKQILPRQNNNNKERAILIMGNSHTRQIASTLLCQYRKDILNATWLFSLPDNRSYGVLEVKLRHNFTIYISTNCPFVYSHDWHEILESPQILNRSLNTLDAIIVGRFNHYTESTGTKFYDAIMGYQRQLEGTKWTIDFEHIMPPTMADVAKVYTTGPIVYVGMFAYYGLPLYQQAKEMVKELTTAMKEQHRQPQGTAVINGRKYIHKLHQMEHATVEALAAESTATSNLRKSPTTPPRLPVQECVSDNIHNVSTCNMDTSNERHKNGHRCMGSRGGHPDLLVWDLVDALHQLVPKTTTIENNETEDVQEQRQVRL